MRTSTANKLIEAGLVHDWQLKVVPQDVLTTALPAATHSLELVAFLHAQLTASGPMMDANQTVVTQMQKMI